MPESTNSSSPHRADVVVVGLGAWGSQALWRLAARGINVLGIERFSIGHDLGSTHGDTRLFRAACLEHPGLASFALRAQELWNELGEQTDTALLDQSGALVIGRREHASVGGTIRAAEAAGLPLEQLTPAQLSTRFPAQSALADGQTALWDPLAGIARPEAGVVAAVAAAETHGAQVLSDTRVTALTPHSGGVTVTTAGLTVEAGTVVVAAGAWLPSFTSIPLAPRRTPLFWFRARDEDAMRDTYDIEQFPAFIRDSDDGETSLWGHGARYRDGDSFAIKIGLLDDGRVFDDADPDRFDRYITPSRDYAALSAHVEAAFPGIDPVPYKAIPCIVTNSVDGQFVIGPSPESERVIVAGGDSGHGHKHAPAVGELLAQLATGESPFTDIGFVSTARDYDIAGTWQKNNSLAARRM